MSDQYLVWSSEHGAWWRKTRFGYSRGINGAGRYSREEALEICRNAIPTAAHIGYISEIPVRLADVEAFIAGQILPKVITDDVWE